MASVLYSVEAREYVAPIAGNIPDRSSSASPV